MHKPRLPKPLQKRCCQNPLTSPHWLSFCLAWSGLLEELCPYSAGLKGGEIVGGLGVAKGPLTLVLVTKMYKPTYLKATKVYGPPECVESAGTSRTYLESTPSMRGRSEKLKFPLENDDLTSFEHGQTSTNSNPSNGHRDTQKAGNVQ